MEAPCEVEMSYQQKDKSKRNGRYVGDHFPHQHGEMSEVLVPRKVLMSSARTGNFDLDACGFTLLHHACDSPKDVFLDDERVKIEYYGMVEELVLQATGAKKVLVFDHNVRSSAEKKRTNTEGSAGFGKPLPRVHCDYTETSGYCSNIVLSNTALDFVLPQPRATAFPGSS